MKETKLTRLDLLLAPDERRTTDEAMADPIRDHVPAARRKYKARGVLRALDKLEKSTPNRRCER